MRRLSVALVGLLLGAQAALAGWTQQGEKLVGAGAVGPASQGAGVAISADGNTAISGGYSDNSEAGAAWVWTRSGTTWTQQGPKLVGSDATGPSVQAMTVGISADGNTAITGGEWDGSNTGAAWIWIRSGTTWSQQGAKLVGSGATGKAYQGYAVALSGDGNTAIVGGAGDNRFVGAVWIFTRSGTTWSQQGAKLVGSGAVGGAAEGVSVALSADGNTALVGGTNDSSNTGAAWVFTRSGTTWTQQGTKLVASDGVGAARQGFSVSLSSDGNTAAVGGTFDNSGAGAAWIWTRSGGAWAQQGSKLVGTGAVGLADQGQSVSLSGDGNTLAVGGGSDNSFAGAAWIWARTGTTWAQQGTKLVGSGMAPLGEAVQGYSVALSADGKTMLSGGPGDDSTGQGPGKQYYGGATWVFVIASAPPTRLAFVQQPTAAVAGQAIAPSVTVQLQDASGGAVAQSGVAVTLSLTTGTGTLSGAASQSTDSSGLATFPGLSINLAGAKQLTAASTELTSAVSSTFPVTAGVGATLALSGGTGQSASVSALFAVPLQVTLTDSLGNPVIGATVTFTPPASGPSALLSGGGSATTDSAGHASVTATANGVPGGPYAVAATFGELPAVRFSLTNLPAGGEAAVPALDGFGLAALALLLAATGAGTLAIRGR